MAGQRSWQSRHFLLQENTWDDDDENAIKTETALAAYAFPAAGLRTVLLGSLHQMVLLRGRSGNKTALAVKRRELSFCRAGPLQRWEANGPAHEQPASGWADASASSTSSMKSTEGAGGTSTVLLTSLHATWAAARPPGIFARNHRAISQPSASTFYPPSASINARTAVAPPSTLQLFFPCRVSNTPSSLEEKFYQAENSHRVICKNKKQIVHGASQITRHEGYVQNSKYHMLLHSLEKSTPVYHETEFSALTLH